MAKKSLANALVLRHSGQTPKAYGSMVNYVLWFKLYGGGRCGHFPTFLLSYFPTFLATFLLPNDIVYIAGFAYVLITKLLLLAGAINSKTIC